MPLRSIVRRARHLAPALLFAVLCTGATCEGFSNRDTKVARGQLYASGDGHYDPYFAQVHQEQVAAASWPDESKAARKPIITALDLRPGASNSTILSSAREKKGDGAVGRAVDETTAAEREREKKLNAAADRLEDLQKKGEDLKKQAIADRQNMAAEKADEAKVAKKNEIKKEISAAVDAVESMMSDARRGAKEAHELSRKLKGAWSGNEGKEEDEPAADKKDDKKKPEAKKPAPAPAAKPEAKKPAPAPAPKPEPKPEPSEQPGEVFNP